MFGYITLSASSSKEDKALYRRAYCGLCHTLKEKYGRTGMLTLSYDMTFLTLLLSDLESSERKEGKERCPVHPVFAHEYFTTDVMSYTADMQILLSYYSLIDKIHDEGKGMKRKEKLSAFIPSIEKKYPRQAEAVKESLSAIAECEKRGEKNPEKLSLLFGNLLGEIFVYDEESFFRSDLFLLGCSIGKFIYLLDAWDDREKDAKGGQFNPYDPGVTYEDVKSMLLDAASLAGDSYKRLPIDDYTTVMDNIIYSGMWTKFKDKKGGKK